MIASSGFVPRWLGWWAIFSGVGLALSRVVWTSEIWLPYGRFWLWVIVLSMLLLRRRAGATPRAATSAAP